MRRKWGVVFTLAVLGGAALHFLYDVWPNPLTAVLAPVNESVWEHLKLLYWPFLAAAFVLARGADDARGRWCGLLVGLLFIIIGNYMPKFRQTYTMGVKTPWALADEENWNHTHRFGGRLWMAAGVVFLALTMLGAMNTVWTLVMILVVALLPVLYSLLYYLRHRKEEDI